MHCINRERPCTRLQMFSRLRRNLVKTILKFRFDFVVVENISRKMYTFASVKSTRLAYSAAERRLRNISARHEIRREYQSNTRTYCIVYLFGLLQFVHTTLVRQDSYNVRKHFFGECHLSNRRVIRDEHFKENISSY